MKLWGGIFICICIGQGAVSSPAFAAQLIENFTTTLKLDSSNSTAVWNAGLGYVHPPLTVDTDGVAGVDTESYLYSASDLGDGSDGSFDSSTYSKFSVNGNTTGNVITIDTNVHPSLNFTNFNLLSGWQIQGTGTNPLWIKVQGNFTNNGTIDCSGGNGDPVLLNITTVANGGVGRCGGGNGGNGGSNGMAATNGLPGCTNGACAGVNTGGIATANTVGSGAYVGGGGGGGGNSSSVGTGGGGGGAAAGSCTPDDTMTRFGSANNGPGGGSGGGGGGAYLFSDANQSRGGGGGGGGGVIRIFVGGNILNNGSILATGGAGGGSTVAAGSGSGGNGGGGTVWMIGAGTFIDNGLIDARHVASAPAAMAPSTGTGGIGCQGRTWLTSSTAGATGATAISGGGSEAPGSNLANVGEVHFSKVAYVAQSLAYDLHNTFPTYNSFAIQTNSLGTSTATLQVAGSNDNFASDNTGWLASTNVSGLSGKRYLKFKLNITQVSPAPSTTAFEVNNITVNYDGIKQTDFNFKAACGYLGEGPSESLFIISICGFFAYVLRRKSQRFTQVC